MAVSSAVVRTDVSRLSSSSPIPPYALHYDYKVNRIAGTDMNPLPPTSDRLPPVDEPPPPRLDYIENKLASHERNTQQLLEKALRLRDDISGNMRQSGWYEENETRRLLQDHIQTITAVCKRLSRDIEALEQQINQRDVAMASTNTGVRTLEQSHVSGVLDLKGRVARCDAAISQLAGNMRVLQNSGVQMGQQLTTLNQGLGEKINQVERKMLENVNQQQYHNKEMEQLTKTLERDCSQSISTLDGRTKASLEELKSVIAMDRRLQDQEKEKFTADIISIVDKIRVDYDHRLDKINEDIRGVKELVQSKQMQHEQEIVKIATKLANMEQKLVEQLYGKFSKEVRDLRTEYERLRKECKDGFQAVQDSMNNLRAVQDGKRKLLEDTLRSEMAKVRRAVALNN